MNNRSISLQASTKNSIKNYKSINQKNIQNNNSQILDNTYNERIPLNLSQVGVNYQEKAEMLDISTGKKQNNYQVNQIPAKYQQGPILFENMTEENLDDWIAQSQNRPIISFLDPYKQFNAPPELIAHLKTKYKRWLKTKEKDYEKKLLYFEDRSNLKLKNSIYYREQQRKEQKNRKITVPDNILQPKQMQGTFISKREDQFIDQYNEIQKAPLKLNYKQKHRQTLSKSRLYASQDQNKGSPINKLNREQNKINDANNFFDYASKKNKIKQISSLTQNFSQIQNFPMTTPPDRAQRMLKLLKEEENREQDILSKIEKALKEDNEKPYINSDQLNFNQHIYEIQSIEKDKNNQDQLYFPFFRATRKFLKGQYDQSILRYKQIIQEDSFHFPSIYNLACTYERLKKFDTSKKWLEIAQLFNDDFSKSFKEDIQYGIALCHFKQKQYKQCYDQINPLADAQNQSSNFEKKQEYLYLRCLCEKLLNNLDKLQKHYLEFVTFTSPQNFQMLMHLMFAIVFKKLRGLEIKIDPQTQCEFNTVVHQILSSRTMKHQLNSLWSQREQKFKVSKERLVYQLQNLSFFKRFSKQQLTEFIPHFQFKQYKQHQLLFPKQNTIQIIIAGHVIIYNHMKNFRMPEIIAYYSEGDILKLEDKDRYNLQLLDIWYITSTDLEVFEISKDKFNSLFKLQQKVQEKQLIYDILSSHFLFQSINELTLYKMSFEMFETKVFNKGDLIFNDCESIQKYQYIQLIKEEGSQIKNFKNRLTNKLKLFEFYQQKIDGFYIITQGEVECEVPQEKAEQNQLIDNNQFNIIESIFKDPNGGYIGENLLFSSIGLSRFGQLKAKSNKVYCLFLPKEKFYRLNIMDKETMKQNSRKTEYFKKCQKLLYKYYKQYRPVEEL